MNVDLKDVMTMPLDDFEWYGERINEQREKEKAALTKARGVK